MRARFQKLQSPLSRALWLSEEERSPDQAQLTRRYTEEAVKFIREHKRGPFFFYFAHTFPHVPLESYDIAKDHPEIVADLLAEIARHRATVTPVESQLDKKIVQAPPAVPRKSP